MALDETPTAPRAAVQVFPEKGSGSKVTVSGNILLSDQQHGPFSVQIIGNGTIRTADTFEATENTRATRRGKSEARRFLRVEPTFIDLTAGPSHLVLQTGAEAPQLLTTIELPELALARFRKLLDRELANGLLAKRTHRRSARLEAAFSDLPKREDDPDWLETSILINCVRKTRPHRLRGEIGRLQDLRLRAGQAPLFDAFMALLNNGYNLALPNAHSFGKSLDQHDRAVLWRGITNITTRLQEMGLTVFLNSGTLLGAIREGDLLGHDDDIDLAVLVTGNSQEQAAASWVELRRKLERAGVAVSTTERTRESILKLPRIEGVQVDLFPAWIDEEDRLFIYPHTYGSLERADLLPLKPGPFDGTRIPAQSERILAQNYGPDWRVPDPLFRFPWDKTAPYFRPFMACLRKALGTEADSGLDENSVEEASE